LYNKNQFMQYDELLGVISSNSSAKKWVKKLKSYGPTMKSTS
jgi:hypothetical protein